jgi:hypothetical protein
MNDFPILPFLTEDFAPKGNGIDFLGLRQVNLNIVQTELVPDINNVTIDVGTYFLGTWIAWKFLELCGGDSTKFTLENFNSFKEAVEVAIAHSSSDTSPTNKLYGRVRNRVGNEQKIDFSGPLSFERASRNASLYDAPLYGPSIRYLGFTQYVMSTDHGSAGFMIPSDDSDIHSICHHVDACLKMATSYNKLVSLSPDTLTETEVFDLAIAGLTPAKYRKLTGDVQLAAIRKVLPVDHRRTETAKLIVSTIELLGPQTAKQLRAIWYTGLTPAGGILDFNDQALNDHAVRWAVFQARQIQRYILESLLCCLERVVDKGIRSVAEIVDALFSTWPGTVPATLLSIMEEELGQSGLTTDKQAEAWCSTVGPDSAQYDFISFVDDQDAFPNTLKSLTRWWLRVEGRPDLKSAVKSVAGDETGRIPMLLFHQWIEERLHDDLKVVVPQVLAEYVFSQHLRIALSRLDSNGIRQRLALGDRGIEKIRKVENFARTVPPDMADRLDALISLMDDLGIVKLDDKVISLDYGSHLI